MTIIIIIIIIIIDDDNKTMPLYKHRKLLQCSLHKEWITAWFTVEARPPLGPTQPYTQKTQWQFSLGVRQPKPKLINHLHVVQGSHLAPPKVASLYQPRLPSYRKYVWKWQHHKNMPYCQSMYGCYMSSSQTHYLPLGRHKTCCISHVICHLRSRITNNVCAINAQRSSERF